MGWGARPYSLRLGSKIRPNQPGLDQKEPKGDYDPGEGFSKEGSSPDTGLGIDLESIGRMVTTAL
jgi:hypothetical protein